jgi:hypothetical protein
MYLLQHAEAFVLNRAKILAPGCPLNVGDHLKIGRGMMFGGVPHVASAIPALTVKLAEPPVRKDRRQVDADAIHHLDRLLGVGIGQDQYKFPIG